MDNVELCHEEREYTKTYYQLPSNLGIQTSDMTRPDLVGHLRGRSDNGAGFCVLCVHSIIGHPPLLEDPHHLISPQFVPVKEIFRSSNTVENPRKCLELLPGTVLVHVYKAYAARCLFKHSHTHP